MNHFNFPVKVSKSGRHFVDAKGQPFFWLGDTAWPLLTAYPVKEAEKYLKKRAAQGFTVIQTVIPWQHGGTHSGTIFKGHFSTPNPYGHYAWEKDPAQPNPKFFKYVDHLLSLAEKLGLTLAILPIWGYFVSDIPVLHKGNARAYGAWLGKRYKKRPNLIWINGGDRVPTGFEDVFRELAGGIRQGGSRHLMTYHPCGWRSSSQFFHDEKWLDFNMIETWTWWAKIHPAVLSDALRVPVKPVVLGEGAYEDGPEYPQGPITPLVVRKQAWWSYLAGGAFTYGQNQQWRMEKGWVQAMDRPGAGHMAVLKRYLASKPWWKLVADQGVFTEGPGNGTTLNAAARSVDGSWILVYLAGKGSVSLHLDHLTSSTRCKATWIDPMTGEETEAGVHPTGNRIPGQVFPESKTQVFTPPSASEDFLLSLEAD